MYTINFKNRLRYMLYYRKNRVNSSDKDLLRIKRDLKTILYDVTDNKENISALNTKINNNINSIKDIGKSNDEQEKNIGYLMEEVKTNINNFPTYNFDEYRNYPVNEAIDMVVNGKDRTIYKTINFNYYGQCLLTLSGSIVIDYDSFGHIGYIALFVRVLKHGVEIDNYELLGASGGDNSKEIAMSTLVKSFLISKSVNDLNNESNHYKIEIYLKNIRTGLINFKIVNSNFELKKYKILDINNKR